MRGGPSAFPRQSEPNAGVFRVRGTGLCAAGSKLRFRRLSCSVPQVKHLDHAIVLMDTVVDQDWTVNQLTDRWTFLDPSTHAREAGE
jgi:hypothetical protein